MTTTNPWERLREAVGRFGDFADHAKKCHVTRYRSAGVVNQTLPACTCGFGGATDELRAALAALPPAQTDAEREKAIEAWRKSATDTPCQFHGKPLNDVFEVHIETIDEAVALMRSAPQPAVEPVHLSSMMHPKFVMCGIECTPSVKRTRRKPGVTCHECLRVAKMGDEAAKPVPAPPASDWRERWNKWVKAGSLWDTIDDGAIGRPCIGSPDPDDYGRLFDAMRKALAADAKEKTK